MHDVTPLPGERVLVLLPVFDDWPSLDAVLRDLDQVLTEKRMIVDVLIVDDGSTLDAREHFKPSGFVSLQKIDVLRLRRNLGHQRAIAVGLTYAEQVLSCPAVVVMDSDGEDDCRDVPRLIQKLEETRYQKVIFAERTKRSEQLTFRGFYLLYRMLYWIVTGHILRVGNFSAVPRGPLSSLVSVSELWNHYPAAVYRSRQKIATIPTHRAKRKFGGSKMNFVNLVVHGLSAISVHGDVVGVRLLIASAVLIVVTVFMLIVTVLVRMLTNLAIPGWATSAFGLLLLVLLQAIMLAIVFCFMILTNRNQSFFMPIRDYQYFILRCETVYP